MPELPEVETVRRGLAARAVGRRIGRVEVGRERAVRRVGREAVVVGFTGATIVGVRRRGKYLLLDLDSGDEAMIHLRMSGRILMSPADAPRPPHSHVVLSFADDGEEVRFVDPRTFGEVVVYDPDVRDEVVPELGRLGPDPVVDPFDGAVLAQRLRGRRRALKPLLLDQHVVAGIGNIYADEILHRARLRWDRQADRLRRQSVEVLASHIVSVLAEAIEAGGSTLDDTQYVDVAGETGSFQHSHRVYGRAGLPCLTCGKALIRRRVVAGRSTSWCPACQR